MHGCTLTGTRKYNIAGTLQMLRLLTASNATIRILKAVQRQLPFFGINLLHISVPEQQSDFE